MTRSRGRRSYENTTPQLLSIHKSIHARVVVYLPHPPNAGQCVCSPAAEPNPRLEASARMIPQSRVCSIRGCRLTASFRAYRLPNISESLSRIVGLSAGRRMSPAQKDSRPSLDVIVNLREGEEGRRRKGGIRARK
jgi:hypothetical protein